MGHYFWICRCQNRNEEDYDRGDAVERYLDGFHGLGTLRVHGLLSFPHGFSVAKAGAGAKNGIFEHRCKVVSTKDWCFGIPTLIDVRDDPSVNICVLGWTRIGVVVVEIWGEIPPRRGKNGADLNGGNGMERQGVAGLSCNFNRCWR